MRLSVIAVMPVVFFAAPIDDVLGHNLAVTSNLSPYLYLTRNDMLRTTSFPAYHKLVRPELDRRMRHSSSWSVQPPLPELSPYLHLGRKDVTPGFPIYHRIVLPRLDQATTGAVSGEPSVRPECRFVRHHCLVGHSGCHNQSNGTGRIPTIEFCMGTLRHTGIQVVFIGSRPPSAHGSWTTCYRQVRIPFDPDN
ncbi:MAG: hypothetical protein R3C28_00235 [Pirellulaceae bacterium]